MRPPDEPDDTDGTLYECSACGFRDRCPASERCPTCAGRLRNIGAPRDL